MLPAFAGVGIDRARSGERCTRRGGKIDGRPGARPADLRSVLAIVRRASSVPQVVVRRRPQ